MALKKNLDKLLNFDFDTISFKIIYVAFYLNLR